MNSQLVTHFFAYSGAKETTVVRAQIEAQLEELGVGDNDSQMTVFKPAGAQFEVDDDYTPIYIPNNLDWRWELSSKMCGTRIKNHWALWNIGWRPESHKYFPTPFRHGAKELMMCMHHIDRYRRSDSECSKLAEANAKKLIEVDLEGEKFATLDERDFLVRVRWADAQVITKANEAHIRKKPEGLAIKDAMIVKDGLHFNCMPLNIQLGSPAANTEDGGGVRIAVDGHRGVKLIDARSGLNLREWAWREIKWVDVVEGDCWNRVVVAGGSDQVAAKAAEASPTATCTLRFRIEDDPGLPKASPSDVYGRTSKCQAGRWRFYCPPAAAWSGDLVAQARDHGYCSGGAKMADAVVAEHHDRWIDALQMRLGLVEQRLAVAKAQGTAGPSDLERLQEKVDVEKQKRFVYEFQVELRRLEVRCEEDDHDEERLLAEANQLQAQAEAIAVTDDDADESQSQSQAVAEREQLVARAEEKRREYREEVLHQAREFRSGALKEGHDLWVDAFKAMVARSDRLSAEAHRKGMAERNGKRQERLYAKAESRRRLSDDLITDYFSLVYKKNLEQAQQQAEEEDKAGRRASAAVLWKEHKSMVMDFWQKYMVAGGDKDKAPTFYFTKLLYNLHFKRQIEEDDDLVKKQMGLIMDTGKHISKLGDRTEECKDAAEKAQRAYDAVLAPLNSDWEAATGSTGEFLDWLSKQGEGEEFAELEAAKEAADSAGAAFSSAKEEEEEADAQFLVELDKLGKLQKAGVAEAWQLWDQAFKPTFDGLRAESKAAFELAKDAARDSVPQGRKRKEIRRAEECKRYAEREARRATLLHIQAEDLAATFWHIALKRKVECIEQIFELAEKLREEDEERDSDDEAVASSSSSSSSAGAGAGASAPPKEDMGKIEADALREKTKLVTEFYARGLGGLVADLMDREARLDPKTAPDGEEGDPTQSTVCRMQAIGLLSGVHARDPRRAPAPAAVRPAAAR
jgi:hypothetical protein